MLTPGCEACRNARNARPVRTACPPVAGDCEVLRDGTNSRGIVSPRGLSGQGFRHHCRGLAERRGPREQALRTQPPFPVDFAQAQRAAGFVVQGDAAGRRTQAGDGLAPRQALGLRLGSRAIRAMRPCRFRSAAGRRRACVRRARPVPAGLRASTCAGRGRDRPTAGAVARRARRSRALRPGRARGCARRCRSRIRRGGAAAASAPCSRSAEEMRSKAWTSTGARLDFHDLAAARARVQRLAAALERGIDRRALHQLRAGECAKRRVDRADGEVRHRPFAQRLAFGVVGVGGDAQVRDGLVRLARAEQAAGDLGRFAEAHRQQAGRERIEAAGVAGLVRAEQVPDTLQGLVGTQALRFVEQQDAVELAKRFASAPGCSQAAQASSPGWRSPDVGASSRSSWSMRSPLSTESS